MEISELEELVKQIPVLSPEEELERRKQEKLDRIEERKNLLLAKGVDIKLIYASEKDYKPGVVKKLLMRKNLLIAGNSGGGKSHLIVAMLKILIEKKRECQIFHEYNMNDLKTLAEKQKYINKFKNVKYLFLDDLGGVLEPGDKALNMVKALIYYRMSRDLHTIIATNCNLQTLFDSRTVSKFFESFAELNYSYDDRRKLMRTKIKIEDLCQVKIKIKKVKARRILK